MNQKHLTDEAVVLRTHNVGETDRFCILLTRDHGKIAARAQGVRRLVSRRAGGLLPLHRSTVTLERHSFGYVLTAAACLDAHTGAWRDPQAFGAAARGVELVLAMTEEGVPLPEVYDLTVAFLSSCRTAHSSLLVPVFTCKLLSLLGFFPSATRTALDDACGMTLSPVALALLRELDAMNLAHLPETSVSVARELEELTQGLLGSHVGAALASLPVSLALSSAVTPICQESGRASYVEA